MESLIDQIMWSLEPMIRQRAYDAIVADLGMFDPCELEWYIQKAWEEYVRSN